MKRNTQSPALTRSLLPLFWFPLLFLIPFTVYLLTLGPAFLDDDSPETIAAGWTLGIQHPPGYPLAALTGRLASLLPLGGACFRINLLSAVTASLAVFLLASNLFQLLRLFLRNGLPPGRMLSREAVARWVALSAALLLAFSYSFWEKALGAKGNIYLLENLLLLALSRCLIEQGNYPSLANRWFYMALFLFGIGLSHHWQTQILFLPVLLLLGYRMHPREAVFLTPSFKNLALVLSFLSLGLSLLLYLPLRSALNPLLNLGAPHTFSNFLASLSRQYYFERETGILSALIQSLKGIKPWESFYGFILSAFDSQGTRLSAHLLTNMHWGPLLLAVTGFFYWRRTGERIILLSLLLPSFLILFTLYVLPTDPQFIWVLDNFLIPLNWIIAALAVAGFCAVFSLESFGGFSRGIFLTLLFFTLPLQALVLNFHRVDQEKELLRVDYGQNLLKSLPSGSIFFAEGDEDYFPLYYLQGVEGRRPDVKMIPTFLLFEPWGVKEIEDLYPGLGLTASSQNFPDHISRIIFSTSEILQKNSGHNPCAFSYLEGAFHRYYLSRHPQLMSIRSGVVLELDSPPSARGPWLETRSLRIRHSNDFRANRHPSLQGIKAIYQKAGVSL